MWKGGASAAMKWQANLPPQPQEKALSKEVKSKENSSPLLYLNQLLRGVFKWIKCLDRYLGHWSQQDGTLFHLLWLFVIVSHRCRYWHFLSCQMTAPAQHISYSHINEKEPWRIQTVAACWSAQLCRWKVDSHTSGTFKNHIQCDCWSFQIHPIKRPM